LCSATGTQKLPPAFFYQPQWSMEDNVIKYVILIATLFGTTAPAFAADY
jgi:hypothetical protein